jgi:alkylated DNA repair dioxygenase AlkB
MEEKVKGIVILRNILSIGEQLRLIDIVEKKDNLKDENDNWNFLGKRGRNFCNIKKYSEDDYVFLKKCVDRFKQETEKLDDSLVWNDVTHVLTLWYPNTQGISWHRDIHGSNNGDRGAPVYSLTLGNSCIFEYKLVGGDGTKIKVQLNSGDLIVFGGAQRQMLHAVTSVIKGSFDKKKDFDARINMTFRTCSNFTEEKEERYQTENYIKKYNKIKEKYN